MLKRNLKHAMQLDSSHCSHQLSNGTWMFHHPSHLYIICHILFDPVFVCMNRSVQPFHTRVHIHWIYYWFQTYAKRQRMWERETFKIIFKLKYYRYKRKRRKTHTPLKNWFWTLCQREIPRYIDESPSLEIEGKQKRMKKCAHHHRAEPAPVPQINVAFFIHSIYESALRFATDSITSLDYEHCTSEMALFWTPT